MQQITMSRVELYQIKTGFTRVSNGLTEIIDDTRNLFQFKRTRHGCFNTDRLTIFIAQRSTCSRAKCGRRYRCLTARLQAGVRNASGVPQLYGHMTIFSMNASGNFFPCGNLFRTMDARCTSIPFCLGRNLRGFANNQTGTGTLAIVFRHQRGRDVTRFNTAQTRQRCHKNTICRRDRAHFQWGIQFFR